MSYLRKILDINQDNSIIIANINDNIRYRFEYWFKQWIKRYYCFLIWKLNGISFRVFPWILHSEYYCKYYLPYALNIIISNTLILLIIPWTWITFFVRSNVSPKKKLKVMGGGYKTISEKLAGPQKSCGPLGYKVFVKK